MGLFGNKVQNRALEMANGMMPKFAAQGAIDEYAAMPMQKRGGLFGRVNLGDVAGGLAKAQAYIDGDWGAAQSITTPSELQRQAEMMREQSLAKSEAEYADFVRREQWKRDNPMPTAPNDTERDYQFMVNTVGKDAADNWLRRRGDPLVNMTLPNGQFYSGPASQLPQALGGGAKQPSRKQIGGKTYEQRDGQWYEVGGPTPRASGGFR